MRKLNVLFTYLLTGSNTAPYRRHFGDSKKHQYVTESYFIAVSNARGFESRIIGVRPLERSKYRTRLGRQRAHHRSGIIGENARKICRSVPRINKQDSTSTENYSGHLQATLSKLLTYCVLSPTQPPTPTSISSSLKVTGYYGVKAHCR